MKRRKKPGYKELSFEAIIVRYPDEFTLRAIEFARARLEGTPLPPLSVSASAANASEEENELNLSTPIQWGGEATQYLEEFKDPSISHHLFWLSRYRGTIEDIANALNERDMDVAFDSSNAPNETIQN